MSHQVYQEGINFVRSQPTDKLAALALDYIKKEREIAVLHSSLAEAKGIDPATKDTILDLIRRGGVRTSLGVF